MRHVIPFLLLAAPAFADCPSNPDISAEMDDLLARVQSAESQNAARTISNRMWELWARAPDDWAQQLLDDGMTRRAAFDLAGAITAFDALVEYCPDFAEGYNQRAFANFLRGSYAAALPDLERAIELRPRHVAAIAGKGLTLIQLGRIREGQAIIRQALAFNPWLAERQYLSLRPEDIEL
ncbi:hypothetical protein MWU52_08715 [Jannaschia sp. S6380]|uniref:tetratricopeptide repeat protein n=1 Tax=Jannaschia sp. S6380 TaxID=2926408 RepID=UPI001FF50F24|nr:tetratricopeptide repeat protein [Jannaschia sp. S6380]MCK0167626.1 hypothetical protein [Jannaschia sp. S6380]